MNDKKLRTGFPEFNDLVFFTDKTGKIKETISLKSNLSNIFAGNKGKCFRYFLPEEISGLFHFYLNNFIVNKSHDPVECAILLNGEEYNFVLSLSYAGRNKFLWHLRDNSFENKPLLPTGIHELKYKTLFETSNDGIFLLKDLIIIDCNSRAEEFFKCSKKDLTGKTPVYFSPEYQPDGLTSKEKAMKKMGEAVIS